MQTLADPARPATAAPAGFADACGEVPLPEIVAFNIARLRAIGYLERFGGSLRQLGLTDADIAELGTASPADIDRIARTAGARTGWLDDPEAHLRAAGSTLTVVVGEDAATTIAAPFLDQERLLERFAGLRHDVRLWVGVDPHAAASLDKARALLGHPRAAGLAVSPFMAGVAIDDPAYAPALRLAAETGAPVWVHASAHFYTGVAYDIGHVRHLDRVLRRHPGLRLMVGHAGWPWTDEACIVAVRHPSLTIEFSTFPPALVAEPGWSLTPLLAQRAALPGRIFFGSGPAIMPRRLQRLLGQLDALGLGDDLASWRGSGLRHWLGLPA